MKITFMNFWDCNSVVDGKIDFFSISWYKLTSIYGLEIILLNFAICISFDY